MFKNSTFARHETFLSCIWWQKNASKTRWATTLGMSVILAKRNLIFDSMAGTRYGNKCHWLRLLIHKDYRFFGSCNLRNVFFKKKKEKKSYKAGAAIINSVEISTSPTVFYNPYLKCCVVFNLLENKKLNIAFFEEVTAVWFIVQYYHNVPIIITIVLWFLKKNMQKLWRDC